MGALDCSEGVPSLNISKFTRASGVAAAVALALLGAGCGQKAADDGQDQTAALDQRERELALREAEVNLKERGKRSRAAKPR